MKKRGGSWFMKLFQKKEENATSANKPAPNTVTAPNKPAAPNPASVPNKPSTTAPVATQNGGSRRRKRRKTRKSRRK